MCVVVRVLDGAVRVASRTRRTLPVSLQLHSSDFIANVAVSALPASVISVPPGRASWKHLQQKDVPFLTVSATGIYEY